MNSLFTRTSMFIKTLTGVIVLSIAFAAVYGQSAWRDGIFYLKVKDPSIALPMWQSGQPLTQLDAFPELKNLVTTYNITGIRPASKIPAVLSAPHLYDRLSPEIRKQLIELSTFYRIDFAVGGNFEAFRNALQALRYVQSVDGEPIRKTGLTGTPNDLRSNTTPAAGPGTIPPLDGQWYLYTIGAGAAWSSFSGSATPVVVAVIDDGFRITHQDYNPVRWINPVDIANGIDDDGNGKIDDINGWDVADNDAGLLWGTGTRNHGMHCAGLAAAATDNGLGVASIAHNQATIWGVKAAQNSTPAPNLDATTEGVEYVIETFVRHKFVHSQNYRLVVSMSFSGPAGFSFYEQTLFNFGAAIDIVFFAAAGNNNVDMTTNPYYPCSYDNVICVGSTDNAPMDVRSSFSNYGPQVDIMAPGENMLSLEAIADNQYYRSQGTSMATPVAAGLACLLLKNNPALTRDEVEGLLRSTAVNIYALPGNGAYINKLGAGRINAAAAISASLPNRLDASPVAVVSPAVTTCLTTVTPQVKISNPGSVTITSITLNVKYDAAPATDIPFGPISIPAGGNIILTLPSQTLTTGPHTLQIITQNPNAGTDMALMNDTLRYLFTIFNTATPITLPFTETFESGSFATNGWVVDNPDAGNQGWQIRSNAGMGNGGLRAATVNIVNYDYYRGINPLLVTPPRDGLISRPIDLTSVATHGDVTLKFQHSYRAGNLVTPDTLNVYVSTDCGTTFPFKVWSSGQSVDFTTSSPGVFTDYLPTNANHWSRWNPDIFALPVSVKLNQFIGQTILLKFEVITVGGTNIYVDSIDIRSTPPLTTCQDSVLRLNFPPANSHNIYGLVGGGFFSGHNSAGDRAYAEKFNYGTGYKKLLSAIYNFGFASTSSTANVTLKIWKDDGLNGGPGTVLASSTRSISSIAGDVIADRATIWNLTTPVDVVGNFFVGYELPLPAGPNDSVAILAGKHTTATYTGWRQGAGGTWETIRAGYTSTADTINLCIRALVSPATPGPYIMTVNNQFLHDLPNPAYTTAVGVPLTFNLTHINVPLPLTTNIRWDTMGIGPMATLPTGGAIMTIAWPTPGLKTVQVRFGDIAGPGCKDTMSFVVNVVNSLPLPFLETFEATSTTLPGWTVTQFGAGTPSWEVGVPDPTGVWIDSSFNGTRVACTNCIAPALQYNASELSMLNSPKLNLAGTQTSDVMVSFAFTTDINDVNDSIRVFFRVSGDPPGNYRNLNGPFTYSTPAAGYSYYNSPTTGVAGRSFKGYRLWRVASTYMPSQLFTDAQLSEVTFHITLFSNGTVQDTGAALDDFHVFVAPSPTYYYAIDTAISFNNIVTRTGVSTGAGWVDINSPVDNQRTIAINDNGTNLGNINVEYMRDNTPYQNPSPIGFWTYNLRYWRIQPTNDVSGTYKARLFFWQDDFAAWQSFILGAPWLTFVEAANRLPIYKYDCFNENMDPQDNSWAQGCWTIIPAQNVNEVPYYEGYYAEFDLNGFSEFYQAMPVNSTHVPFPVEALILSGEKQGVNSKLKWIAANERSVNRFEIELATDRDNSGSLIFRKLGQTVAAGETNEPRTYFYFDTEIGKLGKRYYRIKVVDNDGQFMYSNIIELDFGTDLYQMAVFPNPFSDETQLQLALSDDVAVNVSVIDVKGSIVADFVLAGRKGLNRYNLPISQLPSGVYELIVSLEGQKMPIRIVKQ